MPNSFDQIAAAATAASPTLDPDVVTSITQMSNGDLSGAISAAQATEGAGASAQWADSLKSEPDSVQNSTWASMSTSDQQMLRANGYAGPPGLAQQAAQQQHAQRSIVGSIFHDVFQGKYSPVAGVVNSVKNLGSAAAQGLSWAGQQVQHGFRAEQAIEKGIVTDQNGQTQYTPGVIPLNRQSPAVSLNQGWSWKLLSPSSWQKAWTESGTGNRSYDPARYRAIATQYSPDVMQLAEAKAEGREEDILAGASTPNDLQGIQQRLDTDPQVQAAAQKLNDAKVSFGRMLLPDSMWQTNPTLAHIASGTADAIFDIKTDPLIQGAPIVKAFRSGKYIVDTPEAVAHLINTDKSVGAWVDHVDNTLSQENGAAALLRQRPHLDPAVSDMAKSRQAALDAGHDWSVADYLKSNAGIIAMAEGKLAATPLEYGAMPRLTTGGQARIALKGLARKTINFMADSPAHVAGFEDGDIVNDGTALADKLANGEALPKASMSEPQLGLAQKITNAIVAPIGTQLRRTTTMVTKGTQLDLSKPNALTQVQRFADTYLPATTADKFVDAFAKSEIGQRRNIYKSMLSTVADRSGGLQTPEGRDFWENFIQKVGEGDDTMIAHSKFAPGDISSQRLNDEVKMNNGIWEDQASTQWTLPSFKQMSAYAQRNWINRTLYGYSNGWLSNIYMQAWKPMALLRLGFGIRIGLDELGGALARHGLGVLGANAAANINGGEGNPFIRWAARGAESLSGYAPGSLEGVKTPADLVGGLFGARAAHVMRNVATSLTPDRYLAGAKLAAQYGHLDGAFSDDISAVEGNQGGMRLDDGTHNVRVMKAGSKVKQVSLRPTGAYQDYDVTDPLQVDMLASEMNKMAARPAARELMSNINMSEPDLRSHMADYIQNNGHFNAVKNVMTRGFFTNDGRQVGIDATDREASEDWAQTMIDHVKSVFTGQNGEVNRGLLDQAAAGNHIARGDVEALANEQRPKAVLGPEIAKHIDNRVLAAQDLIEKGFRGTGRIVDWMSRQGLWTHNFTVASEEARPLLENMLGKSEETDKLIAQVSASRAYRMTAPFIHDPKLRTQFENTYQNLIPFMFAQRQFYTRWGKTVVHSPEAFRKAQLFYNGLENVGFIQHDAYGSAFYHLPATGALQDALLFLTAPMFGQAYSTPLQVGFNGAVKSTVAGLDRGMMPGVSPLVAVPLNALATHFKTNAPVNNFAQFILGNQGYNPNLAFDDTTLQQVMPGAVGKIVTYIKNMVNKAPNDAGTQYGSAMFQAMQMLQATGHGLDEHSTPYEQQEFIDRAKQAARNILLTRLVLGLSVPAAPELAVDSNGLHAEYRSLITKLGLQNGAETFIREHPDASAWTLFASQDVGGGGYLPAYQGVKDYMDQHSKFFSAYNQAAPYFVPYNPVDKSFDLQSYREQVNMGLREFKQFRNKDNPANSLVNQLAVAHDSETYWANYDEYQTELSKIPKGAQTQLNKQWSDWRTQFLNTRPLLAQDLIDNPSTNRKLDTLAQLSKAINDPHAPTDPQAQAVATVIKTYDAWLDADKALKNKTGYYYTYQRQQMKQQLSTALTSYVSQHPEVTPLYTNLIRPIIDPGANAVNE